jgi:hypothetical protein
MKSSFNGHVVDSQPLDRSSSLHYGGLTFNSEGYSSLRRSHAIGAGRSTVMPTSSRRSKTGDRNAGEKDRRHKATASPKASGYEGRLPE